MDLLGPLYVPLRFNLYCENGKWGNISLACIEEFNEINAIAILKWLLTLTCILNN
jgi:hypothetical protein